jgi:hypothetical protein
MATIAPLVGTTVSESGTMTATSVTGQWATNRVMTGENAETGTEVPTLANLLFRGSGIALLTSRALRFWPAWRCAWPPERREVESGAGTKRLAMDFLR